MTQDHCVTPARGGSKRIPRKDIRPLRAAGVGTQVLYIPVHLQPWYRDTFGYGPAKCPVAESFYARALSLPLYPTMTDGDVAKVIARVEALELVAFP